MSNFEFMKKQKELDSYPAFDRMYKYLISAEKYYYLDHQLCGMNVRWALEQFCCLVSDLTDVQYDTKPTYMGQFLSQENKLKLLIAVRGEVNYRAICEINSISREYAHSIACPDEELYEEMLPKIYALVVWLYKVLLGIELNLTYSSFSYDIISRDDGEMVFTRKDDVVYTTKEQVARIKSAFPNCDATLLYSIRKTDEKFELLDENGTVVETYIKEEFITVNDDLRMENEKLSVVKEQLRHTIEMQSREKQSLEEKVNGLTSEIEAAEKKISELEINFQTQTEAYEVLIKIKSSLQEEKKHLEGLLKKSLEEYACLSAILKEEIKSYKEDNQHLETLLSNAEAQVAYYRTLVEKYSKQMHDNTSPVLANVERFEKGYQIYKRTRDEEEFRRVLVGIRYIIDGVHEEVKRERTQREQEKADTDRKIKRVERMMKKNNYIWVALIGMMCVICICLVGMVVLLINNKEVGTKTPEQIDVTVQDDENPVVDNEETFSQTDASSVGDDADAEKDEIIQYPDEGATELEKSPIVQEPNEGVVEPEDNPFFQNPDERLDELYKEREEKNSLPRVIPEIEDINATFLSEYNIFVDQLEVFYELARWAEESEVYQILSKKNIPFYEDLNDFFVRRIYTITDSEEIKFVYMRHSAYSSKMMYGMAVAPEALSVRLSYDTTKEEVVKVFGAEYCKEKIYNMGNLMPEMNGKDGVVLEIRLNDCDIYIYMDETGSKIVDYIYILGEE